MQLENRNKALIRKYIDQKCTPEELEDMKKIMLLPGAQHLFDEVLAESWTGLEAEKDINRPHLDQKLQQFYLKLQAQEGADLHKQDNEQTNIRFIKRRKYLRYAAIWTIMVLGAGIYALTHIKKTPLEEHLAMREQVNPMGKRSKIILPDSSEVYLGADSKLSFPEQFSKNSREIFLEGEAFFEITKNVTKPFIVHTRSVQTRVLGTSFKIEAFKNQPLVVAVATGRVRVDDYNGNKTKSLGILDPGQKITYSKGNAITETTDAIDIGAWKDARLVFHKRSLKQIAMELERWYNMKFIFHNKAKANEKISVVLQADVPLNRIMKVLSATGHFQYTIDTNNVTIK